MAFQVSHIPYSSCLSSKLRSVPRGDPELQCLECARLHVTPNRANQCHPGPNPIVAERAETQRYLENWKATSNALTWHRVKSIVLNQMKHNFDSIYLCVCVCVCYCRRFPQLTHPFPVDRLACHSITESTHSRNLRGLL